MLFIFSKHQLCLLNFPLFVLVEINSASAEPLGECVYIKRFVKGIWLHTGVEATLPVSARAVVFVSVDRFDTMGLEGQIGPRGEDE